MHVRRIVSMRSARDDQMNQPPQWGPPRQHGSAILACAFVVVMMAACELPNAADPDSVAAGTGTARTATSIPPRVCLPRDHGHCSCVAGDHLDPDALFFRREQWDKIGGSRDEAQGAHGPQLAFKPGEDACSTAREFVKNCPAWDPDVKSIAKELCAFEEGGGVNAHWACVPGKRLDSFSQRNREGTWRTILAVRRARGWSRDTDVTLASACTFAHEFAASCGAWDADVSAVEADVCDIATARQVVVVEGVAAVTAASLDEGYGSRR